ncbi:MAG: RNA pseudouridine synthase [Planctomycetaceae bacterium]|nr:RNA pseudouridine synthase [Planctomycetaceae bacterium]
MRLDAFLAARFPLYSRVHLRRVINAAGVLVDGKRTKAAYRLSAGQRVIITLPELPREGPEPEDVPLDILYEDEHLVAINKPANMVVHPAKGHWSGTLTAALAFHFEQLSSVGGPTRPGIVHRLDRETSGVIVVAKSDRAHLALAAQFEKRTTEKEYLAIVIGKPDRDRDVIDQPIGVHPYQREKMAIRAGHATSRHAKTFYEVVERFRGFAAIKLMPKTGRTHQLRVHMTHAGCPVLCDRLYGGRSQLTLGELASNDAADIVLSRQALHACRLAIAHPISGDPIEFTAPLPDDMQLVLDALRQHRGL